MHRGLADMIYVLHINVYLSIINGLVPLSTLDIQHLSMISRRVFQRTFCSARSCRSMADINQVVEAKAAQDLKDAEWIQQLLNRTEGGGYIVSNAGILGMPVAWGDLDSFQHVNNVRYLKWFEEARVNMFNRYITQKPGKGFENFMSTGGVGPIIRSVDIAWRYPITFPDTVTVAHKLAPITQEDRFELHGVVVSHNAQKVAARIKETIVTVDYQNGGTKAPIPVNILEGFKERLEEQEQPDYNS